MTSWNRSSFSTIFTTSFCSSAASNAAAAFRSFSFPSSSIRRLARRTERSSMAIRTSRASSRSSTVIRATSAPFLGSITTSPSSSSIRMASRTGVLLTSRLLASFSSINRSPGFNSPWIMAFLKVLKTTSRKGRYSAGSNSSFILLLLSDQISHLTGTPTCSSSTICLPPQRPVPGSHPPPVSFSELPYQPRSLPLPGSGQIQSVRCPS